MSEYGMKSKSEIKSKDIEKVGKMARNCVSSV